MRLIDADWILEHKYKELVSYDTYDIEDILKCVPTVEQKYGHWDYYGYDEISNVHIYRCSECECGNREATDYCPHCGIKMNEEVE